MSNARGFAAAVLAAQLGGCALAPPYSPPATPVAERYRDLGPWTPAQPSDGQARGDWWLVFDDPVLNDLQDRVARANPDLAAAVAAYDQARALAAQARAQRLPELDGSSSVQRERRSAAEPYRIGGGIKSTTSPEVAVSLAYEVDLWGRVRDQVAAQGARAEASAADLRSVQLGLQAELADTYIALRGLDAQSRLLDGTVVAFGRALDLTRKLQQGGAVSGTDVQRALAQYATARTLRTETAAQRDLLEHAVAALVGESASTFELAPDVTFLAQPRIPVGAPSTLLQRRPDIAAAERRAAAANAGIGVARAALFPTLTLDGVGGWQASGGAALLTAPNTFWTLGPQLLGAIFDGGARRAGVRGARAAFEQASAQYRSVVLAAFRDVEDQLALANRLAEEARDQEAAVTAARRVEVLATIRYRAGAADYLEVVVAQTTALDAERAAIALQVRRLQASVDLVRALGGGWT